MSASSSADSHPELHTSAQRVSAAPSTMELPSPSGEDLWVFAYGSLMWNPGFAHKETVVALVRGYHRRFCIYSTHYRGTEAAPGLVLGLDRGGACRGLAFRVAARDVRDAVAYLLEREMIGGVYQPRFVNALTKAGTLRAWTFVVERASPHYCRGLSPDMAAATIRRAVGRAGANVEYLEQTTRQLERLGIPDAGLHDLLARVRRG